MARTKKQTETPLTSGVRFERPMSCSDESGVMSSQPVTIVFEASGDVFTIELPPHLVKHCDKPSLFADRIADLVQQFEQLSEDYSITTLHMKATQPMLLIEFGASDPEEIKTGCSLELFVSEVAMNPVVPDRVYRREGDKTLTIRVGLNAGTYRVVPDTPAIRERLASMVGSMHAAADVINRLYAVADPAAFLLSLSGPWTIEPPQGVETETEKMIGDNVVSPIVVQEAFKNDDEF